MHRGEVENYATNPRNSPGRRGAVILRCAAGRCRYHGANSRMPGLETAMIKNSHRYNLCRYSNTPCGQGVARRTTSSSGRFEARATRRAYRAAACTVLASVCLGLAVPAFALSIELRQATIVCPARLSPAEQKAVRVLQEEVQKRTQLEWPISPVWPDHGNVIAVGPVGRLNEFAGPWAAELRKDAERSNAPEGYRLSVRAKAGGSAVLVIGNDARGVLFGVGGLLRQLRMTRGSAQVPDALEIVTSPKYPLRGHQLGYRPKCNSYDAWDLPEWDQYLRDLAIFGCNTIELIPPRSDDEPDSPHFHRPPMEMMIGMSRLADAYGLDVWVWYPAMDADYSKPATVEAALQEWQEVFRRLPRIDAVFVPGGDPGHTQPRDLMALLEKQNRNLRRFHPHAQMWVSPQSFNQAWLDEFIALLTDEHPSWLAGVVYGPQVRVSLARLRQLVPKQYPIRHYPDITHSRQCQFPVPDWDVAYAVTEARECINPRPEGEAAIFRRLQPDTVGFVTYSEGCNDDVNKCIWSGLGWDPEQPVSKLVRQYSTYFIGQNHGAAFAEGLLALERNWRGSLGTNENVEPTLAQFQALDRSASPFESRNWRFQQGLFRAYYDAYVQRRLRFETALEEQATRALQDAPKLGASNAISMAKTILARAGSEPVAPELRARIFELGEALFQSIGMQLSVQKYKAIAIDRGACLDTLDFPLNNRRWLEHEFADIQSIQNESGRIDALDRIVRWTDPGPGGYYDDLGNPSRQTHLVRDVTFAEDPEAMRSPRSDFEEDLVVDEPDEKTEGLRRLSWMDHAETLYDAPLRMRYTGLDPDAEYKLRVVYAGDNPKRKIRLQANDNLEIHPYLSRPVPFKPIEFEIPRTATRSGELTLQWFGEQGLGGNGRGCQVSEVWLLKQSTPGTR